MMKVALLTAVWIYGNHAATITCNGPTACSSVIDCAESEACTGVYSLKDCLHPLDLITDLSLTSVLPHYSKMHSG